jgi:hypothetical protein
MPGSIQSPTYDVARMSAIARHRAVSQRVIAAQFAHRQHRDPSHVLAVLRQLRSRGLVDIWPVDSRLGNCSQRAASLTDKGREWVRGLVDADGRHPLAEPEPVRHYLLQRARVCLAYEVAGYRLLPAGDAIPVMIRRATILVGRGSDRGAKAVLLPRLAKLAPFPVALEAVADAQDRVSFLVPVYQGRSYVNALEGLASVRNHAGVWEPDAKRGAALGVLGDIEPLKIVLVAAYEHEAQQAERSVRRWGERHRLKLSIIAPSPYRHTPPVFPKG